jgi:5'-3' exonuclease
MKALFDGNNLAFRCLYSKHVNMGDMIDFPMWRFTMFNSMYSFVRKNKNVEEVVMAFDSSNSWRYLVYPKYKAHRKKAKAKSDLDWGRIFQEMDALILDFKTHLPFKIIKIDRCEADDIIAVLTLQTKGNKVIISRDEDFYQLLDKAKIYDAFKSKYITEVDHKKFLYEKIYIGQAKDNIPNVKTPSDWPEDKRKPGFGKASFDKLYDSLELEDWVKENDYTKNLERNRRLIDFKMIPPVIQEAVMKRYENYQKPKPEMILKLLQKHEWTSMLDNFTQVEQNLFRLL